MVKFEIKMEEGSAIGVEVKDSAPIRVDVSSPPIVKTSMYGTGPRGKPGVGVTPGGTAKQFFRKKSNEDYDGEWADFDYDDLLNKPPDLNALSNIEIENLLTI